MDSLSFRPLRADEIDVRVARVTAKGCDLLLYKDARCDMNILDETVGPMRWQRSHHDIKGVLHCTVSIYDPDKEMWVSKSDCGTESNTEKEKGEASDSFKRACFNWGIGRELYTAPRIWIGTPVVNVVQKQTGSGFVTYDRFSVEEIRYDENRRISGLSIKNQKGWQVFLYGDAQPEQLPKDALPEFRATV